MIPALQNFRTYGLATEFYRDCKQITELRPTLRDQLLRAAESVVLNLSEGSAKRSAKERARYYSIALASFRECQAALDLAEQVNLVTRYDRLGGALYKLSRVTR